MTEAEEDSTVDICIYILGYALQLFKFVSVVLFVTEDAQAAIQK